MIRMDRTSYVAGVVVILLVAVLLQVAGAQVLTSLLMGLVGGLITVAVVSRLKRNRHTRTTP